MSKDIVECVHWDPEVDPAQQETRKKNKWVLLAGGLAVLAVAVTVSLLLFLPGREPVSPESPTEAGQFDPLPVNQSEPETQQPGADPALSNDPILAQGIEYYKNANYDAAVSNLNLALASNPESGDAYSYRGLSYFSLGKYEDAVSDLTKALPYLGFRADVLTVRGISYYQMGHFPECIADLTRAIELDPMNANNAYTYRAFAYDATGRVAEAAADRALIR